MDTVDPSINLASAMPTSTESNEKALPLEKAETVPEQQDLEPEPEPDFNLWQQVPVFIAMSLGIFIQGLDSTIVGTATATISNEFNSITDIGWYGSAYLLTSCSTQFMFGKLYTMFRVKWPLVISVVILELGSIVSAAAPSSAAFIVGRAIAGCGASGVLNGVLIAGSTTLPLRWRPIFNSSVGGMECIAMVIAPVIGGALTTDVTWRWCFWLNVPVGGFTLAILIFVFKQPPDQKGKDESIMSKLKKLNIPSLLIFTGSIVCLLLALQWGGTTYPWNSGKVLAPLIIAGVSFAAFLACESLREGEPLIPRSLPIWFQAIKGATAVQSGEMLLPSIIGLSVVAISSGFVLSFIGLRLPNNVQALDHPCRLDRVASDDGHGYWICIPAAVVSDPDSAPRKDVPLGLAGVGFGVSFAAAVSISICQNMFTNLLRSGLQVAALPGINAEDVIQEGVTGFLQHIAVKERDSVLEIYNHAVTSCFWLPLAACCVGFVTALGMNWNSVKQKEKTVDEEKEESGSENKPVSEVHMQER
ncbi:hypothetical protein N7452_005257 [Penicillium brevicompactum]|uniref:Major facilitator superfamily (MFS) profile domain-containing protein n=1 Tax=Penicillium brevicompactum TaxID=5074 RepID=A0A9W9QKP5_PENBR|nr:hypothetical protein N7452_005257 [Penicillium brevicompactum]